MKKIYDDLNRRLLKKTCEVHNKQAHLEFIDGKPKLLCCCDDFKIICYNEIIIGLKAYKAKRTTGALKIVC
jgi:hypothetical protein